MSPNNNKPTDNIPENKPSEGRRNALKTLATIPVLGAMAYGVYKKKTTENKNHLAGSIFNTQAEPPVMDVQPGGRKIRIGIIGYGGRGSYLMQALGFATPEYISNLIELTKNNPDNTRYKDFLEQHELKVEITGV